MTNMGDIDIGGVGLDDHVGVVLSDWQAPRKTPHGVIGLDFLSRYLVVIDQKTKRIELYAPDAKPKKLARWSQTQLKLETFDQDVGALYTIEAKLNARSFSFIVDLGASGTIINYPLLKKLYTGIRINESRSSSGSASSRLNDINDKEEHARLAKISRIKIKRSYWRNKVLLVYNATIFTELNIDHKPYGLLGADLLRDRSFAFDFQGGKFYITHL